MPSAADALRVRIDRDTFVTGRATSETLADFSPGVHVAVSGEPDPDGTVLADAIRIGPP